MTGITIASRAFSTLRLVHVPPGAEPVETHLLGHAGVLVEAGLPAVPAWDGLSGVSSLSRRFLTTTTNDLIHAELQALAAGLNGEDPPAGLPEASAARVAALLEEALSLEIVEDDAVGAAPAP
jgi:hypothetical protein